MATVSDRIKAAKEAVTHVPEEYSANLDKIKEDKKEEEKIHNMKEKAQEAAETLPWNSNKDGNKDTGKDGNNEKESNENSNHHNLHVGMGVIDPTGPEDPTDINITPESMA
mmetsp:Transcript_9102/g.13701  ORF Transcript_9102/g.13701 Transcript_9102/m.13701 type:complete len:111 (-) Transcript_9102:154-486(-)